MVNITADGFHNSLPINSSPVEVSEEYDTPQSMILNDSLPMNTTPVEESESNASSSNEQLEHLPEN